MAPQKTKMIALFGGSFDPPHLAHRQVVKYLLAQNRFDEIWIAPAVTNPLKDISSPLELRVKMCELNFGDLGSKVRICTAEEFQQAYTIDLIRSLQKKYPSYAFALVLGSDLKTQLEQWKEGKLLQELAEIYWLPRGGEQGSPFLSMSSSEIRELKKREGEWQKFLLASVAEFVEEHQLYE